MLDSVAPVHASFGAAQVAAPWPNVIAVWSGDSITEPVSCHHRVLEHNLIDGVAPVKAGFDDAQVAALTTAFDAQPGDLLLLVGGE